jgi:hypothetical protein
MQRVVPLRYGVAFRRAFGDPEVFSAFVSDVFGEPIEVREVLAEHSFPGYRDMVKVAYDLYAEDTARRIIVEIQHIRENDSLDRFLYYHCFGIVEQVRSHEDYRAGREVLTLVVLTRKPRQAAERFSYAVMPMDLTNEHGRPLGAFRHKLVIVNAREINDHTPPGVRRWLEFIDDSLDEEVDENSYPDPLMQRAVGAIRHDGLDGEALAALKDEAVWENAKREEREDGRAAGLATGLATGLRVALRTLCDVLGVALTAAQQAAIEAADADALATWIEHVKAHRALP